MLKKVFIFLNLQFLVLIRYRFQRLMGATARQFQNMFTNFSKKFKKPFDLIGQLMPLNFSDDQFLKKFEELYEYLWIEIEVEYAFWKKKNEKVIEVGKKSRYNFPKPENFVLLKSNGIRSKYRLNHKKGMIISREEQNVLYEQIKNMNSVKLEAKRRKISEKLELTQEIEPKYIQDYINKYFEIRYTGQDSVNQKIEIIREISKYKSENIVHFLQKINAVEKNISLRREAFVVLQKLNEKVILRRNSKGKKKESQITEYMIEETPDILIEKIYDDNLEKIKDFDIFLSHSSNDRVNVIHLYKLLNSQNFHVYIDWVNDKYALKRNLLNRNTANVVIQRLNKSKVLIYFHSEASLKSQWTPWEIGYFQALGKRVFVYNPEKLELPTFLQIYPNLHIKDSFIFINSDENEIQFKI